jgi:hypothetical protein
MGTGSGAAWDCPIPLEHHAEPFPVEALPSMVSRFVEECARATQTPPALPGCLALAALAAGAGGRVEVRARNGWVEPCNLYVAVCLPPAERKSAVFRDVITPIWDFEQRTREARAEGRRIQQQKLDVAQRQLQQAKDEAAKAASSDSIASAEAEVECAARRVEELKLPPEYRLTADDVTPEALVKLLAEQGSLSLLSAEGNIFGIMAGRYEKNGGVNIDVFLKAHAGDRIAVDRRGAEPLRAERPALTLGLAIQPEVLRSIARQPTFRGRGLLARFLYALPESFVGRRLVDPAPVTDEARRGWAATLETILELRIPSEDQPSPITLSLSQQADRALSELQRTLEPRLGRGAELEPVGDWAGKLAGAVVRIAGLLHLAEHGREAFAKDIDAETLGRAGRLGEFFLGHALAAFDEMRVTPQREHARAVLDHICRRGVRQVRRAKLAQWLKGRDLEPEELDAALALLVEHHWLRRLEEPQRTGRGRPLSDHYSVNPALGADPDAGQVARPIFGDFGDAPRRANGAHLGNFGKFGDVLRESGHEKGADEPIERAPVARAGRCSRPGCRGSDEWGGFCLNHREVAQ